MCSESMFFLHEKWLRKYDLKYYKCADMKISNLKYQTFILV